LDAVTELNSFAATRSERLGGDWTKVVDQIVVKRLVLSEQGRVGIGTFRPKDEKNQDSTELMEIVNVFKKCRT
jgi:serine protein kinase